MACVVRRIRQHRGREGSLGPIGFLVRFAELHTEVLLEQGGEADGGFSSELSREPRVEHMTRVKAVVAVQDPQIVVRVVEDLFHDGIREQRADFAEVVHGEWINDD